MPFLRVANPADAVIVVQLFKWPERPRVMILFTPDEACFYKFRIPLAKFAQPDRDVMVYTKIFKIFERRVIIGKIIKMSDINEVGIKRFCEVIKVPVPENTGDE